MARRILTVVAILLSIGTVVLTQIKLREHIEGIRAERQKNADDRDAEKARANKAETNLKNTSNTLVRTQNTLAGTSNELVSTKSTLETVTGARDKLAQDLDKAKEAEKSARQELARWDALGIKPEQVKEMRLELGTNKVEIAALKEEAVLLNRWVARLTNELNKYIDPENYVVQLPQGLKGNILVVDPKWEFVVLDIGEKQGVLKDGVMLVHRDTKLIGKVRITNVMADRSIANVMPGWKLDEFREGDKVLF